MEIIFCNKNKTEKLCLKTSAADIYSLSKKEVKLLENVLLLNEGYSWLPKNDGYNLKKQLPVIKA